MTRRPHLTARQIAAVLEKAGFSLARQSGSHMRHGSTHHDICASRAN